eukprot:TRINITY_DN9545_c0_g1_i11.p1 TRINITY_DN9545_c0_g1~~TRINITY_DN9545_c0_g1_i11.p1  ORF type:complete len:693 (+),score=130.41 TRINITY_DN9545_c0_g1_i11:501-2579(+)
MARAEDAVAAARAEAEQECADAEVAEAVAAAAVEVAAQSRLGDPLRGMPWDEAQPDDSVDPRWNQDRGLGPCGLPPVMWVRSAVDASRIELSASDHGSEVVLHESCDGTTQEIMTAFEATSRHFNDIPAISGHPEVVWAETVLHAFRLLSTCQLDSTSEARLRALVSRYTRRQERPSQVQGFAGLMCTRPWRQWFDRRSAGSMRAVASAPPDVLGAVQQLSRTVLEQGEALSLEVIQRAQDLIDEIPSKANLHERLVLARGNAADAASRMHSRVDDLRAAFGAAVSTGASLVGERVHLDLESGEGEVHRIIAAAQDVAALADACAEFGAFYEEHQSAQGRVCSLEQPDAWAIPVPTLPDLPSALSPVDCRLAEIHLMRDSLGETLTSAAILGIVAARGMLLGHGQGAALCGEVVGMEPPTGSGLTNGPDLEGKIALCEQGGVGLATKARLAVKYGAAGLVMVCPDGHDRGGWGELVAAESAAVSEWFAVPIVIPTDPAATTLIRSWANRGDRLTAEMAACSPLNHATLTLIHSPTCPSVLLPQEGSLEMALAKLNLVSRICRAGAIGPESAAVSEFGPTGQSTVAEAVLAQLSAVDPTIAEIEQELESCHLRRVHALTQACLSSGEPSESLETVSGAIGSFQQETRQLLTLRNQAARTLARDRCRSRVLTDSTGETVSNTCLLYTSPSPRDS